MLKFLKKRKPPISEILSLFIKENCPDILNTKRDDPSSKIYKRIYPEIISGSIISFNVTLFHAKLYNHKLTDEEIENAIYGGALMRIVDDAFDYRPKDEVLKFMSFTNKIIKDSLKGDFPKRKNLKYFNKKYYAYDRYESKIKKSYYNLDLLAFLLYTKIISYLKKNINQRNNWVKCIERIQRTEEIYLKSKEQNKLTKDILKRITIEKCGYSFLLSSYLINPNLPSIKNEELYDYFNTDLGTLNKIAKDKKSKPKDFWKRQFLFLEGGLYQLIDDKKDIKIDKELGIITLAMENPLTKEEEQNLLERLLKLYTYGFKEDLSKLKYYINYIKISGFLYQLLNKKTN